MLQFFKGLKITFLTLVISSIIFTLSHYFSNVWLPWTPIIGNVLYGLFIIIIIFAAQFSRSRFSLLSALWLLFYLSIEQKMPWSVWLEVNAQWQVLFGATLFVLLDFIKDRGLLSVHTLYRFFLLGLCGALSFLWLSVSQWFLITYAEYDVVINWGKYLTIELPLLLSVLAILTRSLLKASLLNSAILVSYAVWCLNYYQWLTLPWSILLTILVAHYLLVVIIDSYFLAYRDELTNLPSRRALNQLVLSLGRKYTVAMLDIDHFKKFNDTYGHDIGDQVLKLVAVKLAQVRGGGRVFRYGGEEFTIVFSRKDASHARVELERLRQAIADYKIVIRQPQRKTKQDRKGSKRDNTKSVSVTISIGLAVKAPKQKFEQVLKLSDQARYRAKKKGRNNVSD